MQWSGVTVAIACRETQASKAAGSRTTIPLGKKAVNCIPVYNTTYHDEFTAHELDVSQQQASAEHMRSLYHRSDCHSGLRHAKPLTMFCSWVTLLRWSCWQKMLPSIAALPMHCCTYTSLHRVETLRCADVATFLPSLATVSTSKLQFYQYLTLCLQTYNSLLFNS